MKDDRQDRIVCEQRKRFDFITIIISIVKILSYLSIYLYNYYYYYHHSITNDILVSCDLIAFMHEPQRKSRFTAHYLVFRKQHTRIKLYIEVRILSLYNLLTFEAESSCAVRLA